MPARITANGERVELYVPLTKFDERTGEFEAWATLQELDAHREVCDIEKSWPALLSHAQEQAEFSDGKSVGNLRRQHRRDTAVGKLTKIERSERRGIDGVYVKGKVTDAQTKLDAVEGVVTGISLRGMAERWPDPENKDAKRYAWTLVEEYSIVDRPAVPHALIEVMKSNGEVEMVKARGRDVVQYWDCLNPTCQSMHSRKEEAQKCEVPDEPLPTSIEATAKSEVAADLAYLIQRVTANRPSQECSGCNHTPCGGPPCAVYVDPGHEEMEAGVKQLFDSLRAIVSDLRAKWMSEEGVTEDGGGVIAAADVAKMLDALSARFRDTKEVLKSLRVPTGNGSINNSHKEGTMPKDTKKDEAAEETPAAVDTKALEAVMGKLDEIAGRLDAIEAAQSAQGQAIADLQSKLPSGEASEAQKAAATKLDEIETAVKSQGENVEKIGETVKSLAEIVGNLPVAPKGTLRAATKEGDADPAPVDTTKGAENRPFVSLAQRVI